jgi:hypothetical protein
MRSRLKRLRTPSLEGLTVKTKDLARFLKRHRDTVQSVTLNDIEVEDQPFSTIADVLANEMPSLIEIRLEDLSENYLDSSNRQISGIKYLHNNRMQEVPEVIEGQGRIGLWRRSAGASIDIPYRHFTSDDEWSVYA